MVMRTQNRLEGREGSEAEQELHQHAFVTYFDRFVTLFEKWLHSASTMGASQLGCDSCQSKDDSDRANVLLALPEWGKLIFLSLQNQFLGCHWVTSHGSQQWRHPGGNNVRWLSSGHQAKHYHARKPSVSNGAGATGPGPPIPHSLCSCIWTDLSPGLATHHRAQAEEHRTPNIPCPRF